MKMFNELWLGRLTDVWNRFVIHVLRQLSAAQQRQHLEVCWYVDEFIPAEFADPEVAHATTSAEPDSTYLQVPMRSLPMLWILT